MKPRYVLIYYALTLTKTCWHALVFLAHESFKRNFFIIFFATPLLKELSSIVVRNWFALKLHQNIAMRKAPN